MVAHVDAAKGTAGEGGRWEKLPRLPDCLRCEGDRPDFASTALLVLDRLLDEVLPVETRRFGSSISCVAAGSGCSCSGFSERMAGERVSSCDS